MLPKPPITAAMNALRTGVKPMYGLIWPAWTAYSRPATAASPAPIANAVATTRSTLMPISRAAGRSSAAARIDRPSVVRVTNTLSSPSSTMPATKLAMLTFGIVIEPIVTTPLRTSGLGKAISVGSPARRVVSSVPFWRICPTANEVSSIATSGAPRIGRYATRSISRPTITVPTTMTATRRRATARHRG